MSDGAPNRHLYETAVLATLRDKLRSGDISVEHSSSYRRLTAISCRLRLLRRNSDCRVRLTSGWRQNPLSWIVG
jgi:hypothetical protein